MRPGGRSAVVATAASVAILAAASGIQALLFLKSFGTTARTDGVLAAYSLYVLIVVFAQGIRISGAAALASPRPRMAGSDFAWAAAVLGLLLVAIAVGLDAQLATVVAGGAGDIPVASAQEAMPILGAGAALQLATLTLATLLAAAGRFHLVAVAVAVGGAAGLGLFLILLGPVGELALAWATLGAGLTSSAIMLFAAPPRIVAPRMGRALRAAALVARENLVPLFSTAVYVIAVAVAARVVDQPGELTLFSLAFLASSYLCGVASTSVAIVDAASASDDTGLAAALRRSVPDGFAFARRLGVPLLAMAVVASGGLVEALMPSADGTDPWLLPLYLLLLAPFTVATWASNVAVASWYGTGHIAQLNRALPAILLLQVAGCVVGAVALGLPGVAIASGISTAAFAWVAVRPASGLVGRLSVDVLGSSALAVACFAPPALLTRAVTTSPVASSAAAAVGAALFVYADRRASRRRAAMTTPQ